MPSRRPPGARQYDTHLSLLARTSAKLAGTRQVSLDAIIVPASRPAGNLDHAVTLARALRCQLVVLCSLKARAADVHELLAGRNFDQAIVVDLPPDYGHRLLDDFATSKWADLDLRKELISPNGDLSTKRNLGLLLAKMLGWRRIFFMDDDIRDLAADDLYLTVSMLGPYHAVGMRAVDFPDNSVVCHGHRQTGRFQEVFISGSLLAVECTRPLAFFPAIYNEDWFFFYHNVAERKLGWSGRDATQLCYDPFADPGRAAGQEFGDVLAEGLYGLLHCGVRADQAVSDYWQLFLDSRKRFLQGVLDRSEKVELYLRKRIASSVETAMIISGEITPEMCAQYVKLWQRDLASWEERLGELPRLQSAGAALRQLSLAPSARSALALAKVIGGNGGSTEQVTPRMASIPQGVSLDLAQRIKSVAAAKGGEGVPGSGGLPFVNGIPARGGTVHKYTRDALVGMKRYVGPVARRLLLAEEYSQAIAADRRPDGVRLSPGRHRRVYEPSSFGPLEHSYQGREPSAV